MEISEYRHRRRQSELNLAESHRCVALAHADAHHGDFLPAGGFHEFALGYVPHVLGLGPKHFGERAPRLIGIP